LLSNSTPHSLKKLLLFLLYYRTLLSKYTTNSHMIVKNTLLIRIICSKASVSRLVLKATLLLALLVGRLCWHYYCLSNRIIGYITCWTLALQDTRTSDEFTMLFCNRKFRLLKQLSHESRQINWFQLSLLSLVCTCNFYENTSVANLRFDSWLYSGVATPCRWWLNYQGMKSLTLLDWILIQP
jgi:hypothetical protein